MTRLDPIRRTASDKAIAAKLGVTIAGLRWLSRAAASPTGTAPQGGNELAPLRRLGFVEAMAITDAGRNLVASARAMGW